jgi:hypothetical protein
MCTDVLSTNHNCIERTHPTYSYINLLYLECQWAEIHLCGVTYSIKVCRSHTTSCTLHN